MKKYLIIFVIGLGINFMQPSIAQSQTSQTQTKIYVPDEVTACAIAEAVLKPIYGEVAVSKQHPYKAKLIDGIWLIEGTFVFDKRISGGGFVVRVMQSSGCIVEVYQRK